MLADDVYATWWTQPGASCGWSPERSICEAMLLRCHLVPYRVGESDEAYYRRIAMDDFDGEDGDA